jgi:hypothetical protein
VSGIWVLLKTSIAAVASVLAITSPTPPHPSDRTGGRFQGDVHRLDLHHSIAGGNAREYVRGARGCRAVTSLSAGLG